MKKYYIGLPYLLIGILAAAVYTAIELAFSGSVRIPMIALVVLGVPGSAVRLLAPVTPWSVFSVEGSIIKEERLFEKAETRQADLAAEGVKLYKWQATNGLWLIASQEELSSAEAAKDCYRQKKAVIMPVNNQLKDLLAPWTERAEVIS